MDLIHPHTTAEVADVLQDLSANGTATRVVGGRLHSVERGPVGAEVWTTNLDRGVAYDPAEMLCVVQAGVRLRDLRARLAADGQEWPVDEHGDATVGGVIAADVALPRQLRVGLLRDSVVELHFVTGDGREIRSGARTVKNVTGFDLHRLLTGSRGELGVITQVALKVRPLPKAARTLVTRDGGVALGERLLAGVPLPAAVLAEPDRVVLRLEGWPGEVEEQAAAAARVTATTDADPAGVPEPGPDDATIVRAAVTPSRLEELVESARDYRASVGVGFAWIPCATPEAVEAVRTRARALGGSARVVRGDGARDDEVVSLPHVQRRIKAAFDPAGILEPGPR